MTMTENENNKTITTNFKKFLDWAAQAPATISMEFHGQHMWPEELPVLDGWTAEVTRDYKGEHGFRNTRILLKDSRVTVRLGTITSSGNTILWVTVEVPGTVDVAHENYCLGVRMGHSD